MKRILLSLLGGMALVSGVGVAHATNLIVNGSFELGTFDSSPFDTVPGGSSAITGWTVGGNSVDWIGSYWQPEDGLRSIDLSGNSPGSVSQVLTGLTVGNRYTVSFWLAGNPDGGPTTKPAQVSAGVDSSVFLFDVTGHSKGSMGWVQDHFSFVAGSGSETLTFASLSGTAYGPALDNVSLSVPEASTWAMMLVGFAGVGFAAYRRTKRGVPEIAAA
jgi:choice-of-anchor C domain-containing protein